MVDGSIILLGAGRMGSALLSGWISKREDFGQVRFIVLDPSPSKAVQALAESDHISLNPDLAGVDFYKVSAFVAAVKPQTLESALEPFCGKLESGTLILSIVAGKRVSKIPGALGGDVNVVRAMPNTPASIGLGMTACFAEDSVTKSQRELCEGLLTSVGETAWVADEDLLDAVTGVSGSGPAYVFYLIEAMIEGAMRQGLSEELARQLVVQTVRGAAGLAHESSDTITRLRENVTSNRSRDQALQRTFRLSRDLHTDFQAAHSGR